LSKDVHPKAGCGIDKIYLFCEGEAMTPDEILIVAGLAILYFVSLYVCRRVEGKGIRLKIRRRK